MQITIKNSAMLALSALMLISCSSSTATSSKKETDSTSVIKEPVEDSKSTTSDEIAVETSTPEEISGVSADFKAAMDSYVDFFEQYAEFMKSYDSNDLTMLAKYTELLQQYSETMQKFEELGKEEMTDEETSYYIDTNAKIQKILLDVQ